MRDAALALGSLALILTAWAAFAWLVSRHQNRPRGLSAADRAWAEFVADGKTRAEPLPEARRAWREEDERVMGRLAEPDTALWDPVERVARRDRGRLDEGGWGQLAEAAGSQPRPGSLAFERRMWGEHFGQPGEPGAPDDPRWQNEWAGEKRAGAGEEEGCEGSPIGSPGVAGSVASPRAQDSHGDDPDWQDDPGHDGVTPDPPPPPDDGLGYPPADDFRDWLRDSVVMRAIKEKN